MNLVPALAPDIDGFVAVAFTIVSAVCVLSFLPSILVGVLCARAMPHLGPLRAVMLGIGVAVASYALCLALSALGIFYYVSDEVLIASNVIVSAAIGAGGAAATWRICVTWNRHRLNRAA